MGEAFSLVIDNSDGKTRRLPSFYFRAAQLYAAREIDDVCRRLAETAERFLDSEEEPLYLLHACQLDGRDGLYGRDFFNRSTFRLKLSRLGMTFGDDQFVHLDDDGRFSSADRGSFTPTFLIHDVLSVDSASAFRLSGATLVYWFNARRLGKLTPPDLITLTQVSSNLDAINAQEADHLIAELKGI